MQAELKEKIYSLVNQAEILLVAPPFMPLDRPSLGLHMLQAAAADADLNVGILYVNQLLAAEIGMEAYQTICEAPKGWLPGERFFSRAAYGTPAWGYRSDSFFDALDRSMTPHPPKRKLLDLEKKAGPFMDALASLIAYSPCRVLGVMGAQDLNNPGIALIKRVKEENPQISTFMTGPNCEGSLAEGVAALHPSVDHVLSGECETLFVGYLQDTLTGTPMEDRILEAEPVISLDNLATPNYAQYYEQLQLFLPEEDKLATSSWIPYETSRGCWWGQKQHCTYCGLKDASLRFRLKSPDRVIEELTHLLATSPSNRVCMADNLMPQDYLENLLPRIKNELPPTRIFYQQKANLSLEQMDLLRQSGVAAIQVGIEALTSNVLSLLHKGSNARQNIMMLRYARALGIDLKWNLFWGVPDDSEQDYQQTRDLIPLLTHLQPPEAYLPLSIDRFSPYFETPEKWEIQDIRPIPSYADVNPAHIFPEEVASHFLARYESAGFREPRLVGRIQVLLARWHKYWAAGVNSAETLRIVYYGKRFLLLDTRSVTGGNKSRFLAEEEARALMQTRPYLPSPEMDKAIKEKLAVVVDDWFVPLITAKIDLLKAFETGAPLPKARSGATGKPIVDLV